MHYFTRSRINVFVTMIITAIILLLLVVPIWLLYHLSVTLNVQRSNIVCIGVLLVSTLIFSAVLSLFTKARRHEILAASAGWARTPYSPTRISTATTSFSVRPDPIPGFQECISEWGYANSCPRWLEPFSYCAVLVVFVGNLGNADLTQWDIQTSWAHS